MEPFNYAAQLGLNGPGVVDQYLSGITAGAGLQDIRMNQQAAQAKLQAQQAAQEQAAKQQQMLAEFSNNPNPTAEDYAKITRAMPQLSEGFKRSWDILQPAQRDAHWNETVQVYAATLNNKPEVAAKILNEKAAALDNSGDPAKAEQVRKMAQLAIDDPEYAKKTAYLSLYSFDPDKAQKLAQSLDSQAAAAATLPGQIADSTTKQVQAKYADSQATMDLEKAGWDIKKLQSDIISQKESNRIAAMNAAYNREGNDLKRQELRAKLDDAQRERDDKIRGKVADVQAGAANIDNMLNTIERIKVNPRLNAVVGAIEGRIPALIDDDSADAVALIDTLGSQAFLSQIPNIKGMGALSNEEGKKLQAAFQNLSRTQSETQFKKTLEEASRLLIKGRSTLEGRYGVPLGAPDTPAAKKAATPAGAAPRSIVVDY